jgi:hypothetical protein
MMPEWFMGYVYGRQESFLVKAGQQTEPPKDRSIMLFATCWEKDLQLATL